MEIRGRFLPSRVYNRWKWTVRFGLMLVPFLIFLAGAVILFLTPSKYRSTALFSLENGPPPAEIVELIESRGILDRVVETLKLGEQMNVDRESAMHIVLGTLTTKVVPNTGMVEITATLINDRQAKDIADQIPVCLKDYLIDALQKKNAEKVAQIDNLISDGSDDAGEKAAAVAKLEKIHGDSPADAPANASLQRARRASLLADAEVERLRILRADCLTENIDALPRLVVHSPPVISNTPHSPIVWNSMIELTVQSLVSGLIAALLLPYLMELAFPPGKPRKSPPDPIDDL